MASSWSAEVLSVAALLISGLSLVISALSYRRAGRTKQREWRILAGERAKQIDLICQSIPGRAEQTQKQWKALLNVRGLGNSGTWERLKREIDERATAGTDIEDRLKEATKGLDGMSDGDLESLLVTLSGMLHQANGIVDWFNAKDAEHRQGVEERRKQFEGAARQ